MEKFCPLGRLKRHMLVLNLLLVLYMVRNKEFLLCRKVRSQLSPPGELTGDHRCSRAKQQLFPRGVGGYEMVGGNSPTELNQSTVAAPRSPLRGAGGEEGMGWGSHRCAPLAGHPRHATFPDESSWARGSWVSSWAGCTRIPRRAREAKLTLDALLQCGWRNGIRSSARPEHSGCTARPQDFQ